MAEARINTTNLAGSVPVSIAAKVYGKDACWVRAGIIEGWLPIGTATRHGKQVKSVKEMDGRLGRINYYISPAKLFENTGYLYIFKDKKRKEN